MRDLLHPPAHRGPLIAAGALTLTIGVGLEQERIEPGRGVQFLVVLALAVVVLWLALHERGPGGAPYPHVSVLIVCGLAASYGALLRLADLLGADFGAGSLVWTALIQCGLAVLAAVRRNSAVAALIAAGAGGLALLAAWDWIFSPDSFTPYRWLLLLLAFVYGLASLPLRGTSQRHADQMVNASGVATLVIGVVALSGVIGGGRSELPGFWEFVLLVAGVSLIAYAAADRAPGAAYLGIANLVAFGLAAAAGDLVGWPLFLLVVGAIMLFAGLRPRIPLPPEPGSSTRPDDQPLIVRVDRD